MVLGLAGFYPIHPTSYLTAWRNRQKLEEQEIKAKEEASTLEEKLE